MKKLIMVTLMSLTILGSKAYASEPSSWAKEEVKAALDKGIVPVELQDKYQDPITREEFSKLFVQAVFARFNDDQVEHIGEGMKAVRGYYTLNPEDFAKNIKNDFNFTDTKDSSVISAAILGAVDGYPDGTFRPNALITREQASKMFENYFKTLRPAAKDWNTLDKFKDGKQLSKWAEGAVHFSVASGLLQGKSNGNFDPKGNFTREQAILVLNRAMYDDRSNHLDHIVLNGYVCPWEEVLYNYEVLADGTVNLLRKGFDHEYSYTKEWTNGSNEEWDNYLSEFKSEEVWMSQHDSGYRTGMYAYDERRDDVVDTLGWQSTTKKLLAGKNLLVDCKYWTVEYNPSNKRNLITFKWANTPYFSINNLGVCLDARESRESRRAETIKGIIVREGE